MPRGSSLGIVVHDDRDPHAGGDRRIPVLLPGRDYDIPLWDALTVLAVPYADRPGLCGCVSTTWPS